jgi:hypothetical protein
MSGNHFDQLAQEILKQKQLMDALEAENRELREQIADLRSGRGIFIDLLGTRFALRDDSSLVQTTSASSVPASASPLTSTVATSTPPATSVFNQSTVEAPTTEIAEVASQTQEQSATEQASPSNTDADKKSSSEDSNFLEEILIDEFANALTSPKAVWQDPTEKKQSTPQRKPEDPINEKQKEALRRELMNSFLLE